MEAGLFQAVVQSPRLACRQGIWSTEDCKGNYPMQESTGVKAINAQAYFTSLGLGLKWYNYDDLKRLYELRLTTTAVGYLPARLRKLMEEDAEEMGLPA